MMAAGWSRSKSGWAPCPISHPNIWPNIFTSADGARLEVVQMDDHHHPEAQDIILDSVELAV